MKYRIYDKLTGEFWPWDYAKTYSVQKFEEMRKAERTRTVYRDMYTGLTDYDGRDIYRNDKVAVVEFFRDEYTNKVIGKNYGDTFVVQDYVYGKAIYEDFSRNVSFLGRELAIVGNTHED